MANFYARVKRGQLENSLSYCINACVLRRSERALCLIFLKESNQDGEFVDALPPAAADPLKAVEQITFKHRQFFYSILPYYFVLRVHLQQYD